MHIMLESDIWFDRGTKHRTWRPVGSLPQAWIFIEEPEGQGESNLTSSGMKHLSDFPSSSLWFRLIAVRLPLAKHIWEGSWKKDVTGTALHTTEEGPEHSWTKNHKCGCVMTQFLDEFGSVGTDDDEAASCWCRNHLIHTSGESRFGSLTG